MWIKAELSRGNLKEFLVEKIGNITYRNQWGSAKHNLQGKWYHETQSLENNKSAKIPLYRAI